MSTVIYHNPRCRKSRETLAILEEQGEEIEIVKYLDNPPSQSELTKLIGMLDIKPIDLVRKNEAIWKESFKGKDLSDKEIIEAMADYPKLIERPIVVKEGKARLGRPPESILDFL
jgi:arsenate reductase